MDDMTKQPRPQRRAFPEPRSPATGKALLVKSELEAGAEIVAALDESGLNVNVALRATLSEYGGERLILASRHFDDDSPIKSYGKVLDALREKGVPQRQVPDMLVLRMKDDPFIRDLRKLFGKAESRGHAPRGPVLRRSVRRRRVRLPDQLAIAPASDPCAQTRPLQH